MITDRIEHFRDYDLGPAWELAFAFLNTLDAQSEEKKYLLQGEDVFAIVMRYSTFAPQTARFESHKEYVDIQAVLVGAVGFECDFSDTLTIETHYEKKSDIMFYKRLSPGTTRVDLYPGCFVLFYPHDAHMPGLMIGNEEKVIKKVVVKIRKELIMPNQNK